MHQPLGDDERPLVLAAWYEVRSHNEFDIEEATIKELVASVFDELSKTNSRLTRLPQALRTTGNPLFRSINGLI